jgi:glycopeptide antibiotics resistance protein
MLSEILLLSASGYIFVFLGVVLYFLYLKKSGKKQTLFHIVTVVLFSYYIIGVLTMTGIHDFDSFAPRIVLIPFVDMIKGPIDTVLNVILFLPLGFFISLLYKRYNRVSKVVLTGFLLSLSIELIQMFGMGATDINDLITNTFGALLGYGIYKLLSKLTGEKFFEKFKSVKISEQKEVLLLIVYSFVIMIAIQPIILHSLLLLR